MTVNKIINNDKSVIQIIQNDGSEYVHVINGEDLIKDEETQKQIAIDAYNLFLIDVSNKKENITVQPSIADLAQAVAELSTMILGGA